jgi:methionyl-tRNA formyltransferase
VKIVLVAEEAAGTQALRAVAESGHEVVAVMTSGAGDARRSPVRDLATQCGYPCWPARDVTQPGLADRLRAARVDLLLNVHSLFLIPGDVLTASRFGSYNLHPGPLPEYAGLNAVSWALYRGEQRHAVTLHRMVPEVDAGAIAYEASFAISDTDTALTLSVKCVTAGIPLISRLLATAAVDPAAIPAAPQDQSRRRYFGRGVPQGGRLDWSRSARDVVNFVRACDYVPFHSPWGHPHGTVGGAELGVMKATRTGERCAVPVGTVAAGGGQAVHVAAADEWVSVHRVLSGGRPGDASAWLRAGARFEAANGGPP